MSIATYRAAEALARTGDPAAAEALIKALGDPHQAVRVRAAEALGEIKAPKAVEPFIVTMREEDDALSYFASGALAKIGAPAVPALVANLGYHGPPWWGGAVLSGELIGKPRVMGFRCANEYPIPTEHRRRAHRYPNERVFRNAGKPHQSL